jgi:hypothetical protein
MKKDRVYVIKKTDGLLVTPNRLQSAPNVTRIAELATEMQLINVSAAEMIKLLKMASANAVQDISRQLHFL